MPDVRLFQVARTLNVPEFARQLHIRDKERTRNAEIEDHKASVEYSKREENIHNWFGVQDVKDYYRTAERRTQAALKIHHLALEEKRER